MYKPTVFHCFMSSDSIESFKFTGWFSCNYFTYQLVFGQDYHTSETLSFCLVNSFPGCQHCRVHWIWVFTGMTPFKVNTSFPSLYYAKYAIPPRSSFFLLWPSVSRRICWSCRIFLVNGHFRLVLSHWVIPVFPVDVGSLLYLSIKMLQAVSI